MPSHIPTPSPASSSGTIEGYLLENGVREAEAKKIAEQAARLALEHNHLEAEMLKEMKERLKDTHGSLSRTSMEDVNLSAVVQGAANKLTKDKKKSDEALRYEALKTEFSAKLTPSQAHLAAKQMLSPDNTSTKETVALVIGKLGLKEGDPVSGKIKHYEQTKDALMSKHHMPLDTASTMALRSAGSTQDTGKTPEKAADDMIAKMHEEKRLADIAAKANAEKRLAAEQAELAKRGKDTTSALHSLHNAPRPPGASGTKS